MKLAALTLAIISLFAATAAPQPRHVTIEGHRGARGYLPENTIPSFKLALEQGAEIIELDVVISLDRKVVVSHEPWFSSAISLDPAGRPVPADKQRDNNIYRMYYADVRKWDVGSLGHKDFPEQVKMKAVKPLLSEVFRELAKFARSRKMAAPRFNVEIKTEGEKGDGVFHPAPDEFATLVYEEIRRAKMLSLVKVQSFDVRPLQAMRRLDPKVEIALLVGGRETVGHSIERLGFTPRTYSPHFSLVDTAMVEACRKHGMLLVPWTVNTPADIERISKFDIDGIISDYPDRAARVLRKR